MKKKEWTAVQTQLELAYVGKECKGRWNLQKQQHPPIIINQAASRLRGIIQMMLLAK
jgi:hypothetical protein